MVTEITSLSPNLDIVVGVTFKLPIARIGCIQFQIYSPFFLIKIQINKINYNKKILPNFEFI